MSDGDGEYIGAALLWTVYGVVVLVFVIWCYVAVVALWQ